jgi:uncharacterized membrane protein
MTKEQFLFQLEQQLLDISEEERAAAMEYYRDYFDDAGPENEERIIRELGSPAELAAGIREGLSSGKEPDTGDLPSVGEQPENFSQANSGEKRMDPKSRWILILLVVIATSPLWIGLIGAVFGLLVGAVGALIGLVVALAALTLAGLLGGVVVAAVGIFRFFTADLLTGVMTSGVGMLLIALGLLSLMILVWMFGTAVPWLLKKLSALFRYGREKGRQVMPNE